MQDYAVLGRILEFAVNRVNGFSEYLGHVTESEDQFPQFSVRTGLRAGADG
jgi:hypothetical protein